MKLKENLNVIHFCLRINLQARKSLPGRDRSPTSPGQLPVNMHPFAWATQRCCQHVCMQDTHCHARKVATRTNDCRRDDYIADDALLLLTHFCLSPHLSITSLTH